MTQRINIAFFLFILVISILGVGCAPTLAERKTAADLSMELLQKSDFENAALAADKVLTEDNANPYAALVKAVALYKSTMHQLFADGRTLFVAAAITRSINQEYLNAALSRTEANLNEVQRLLGVAALEPEISMELCVACMQVDWNQDGQVDRRDSTLFEVEKDATDHTIPQEDPRRRPTFRLDYGDVLWAQAFVSFHLAALNLATAYDYRSVLANLNPKAFDELTFKLVHPEKITLAQQQILDGLSYSLASRDAYLQETDDDREWLPNPRQKNHPIPLEVTDEFYETWRLVVTDLQKIVSGEESLSVAELAQLGDHRWENPPTGYINIGKLFVNAKDITIRPEQLEDQMNEIDDSGEAARIEQLLEDILGFCYVKHAKATPLLHRMDRMKNEVERGHESIERKLKYLFWVN